MAKYTYDNLGWLIIEAPSIQWAKKVGANLDLIKNMAIGPEFFGALARTGKTLTIGPRDVDASSNYCEYPDDNNMNLLTRAIVDNNATNLRSALAVSLRNAERSGITKDWIAMQLAQTLGAVTYDNATNAARPAAQPMFAKDAQSHMAHLGHNAMQARAILDEILSGKRTDLPSGWAQDLQRLLRNHVPPGRGTNPTIGFDPDQTYPCDADPARKNRPPVIGLAHEMVHALRGMSGKMLEVRNGSFDLEEVITTGFAPYNSEPFCENLFRSQFSGKQLIMRETYSWLPNRGYAVPSSS